MCGKQVLVHSAQAKRVQPVLVLAKVLLSYIIIKPCTNEGFEDPTAKMLAMKIIWRTRRTHTAGDSGAASTKNNFEI